MFDGILKPKFYKKCKSATKFAKLHIEMIMRKRNAVEKILKNDVVELLKCGLDYDAYGKAEVLLMEQNKTARYQFVDQFCNCIQKNLSTIQKESECPEECREAVSSLIYAAARIADLPELRDLRTLFNKKYVPTLNKKYVLTLDTFVNDEFAQKFRADPPTKEMRLQLMHDIAEEFSFEWDPKALEQKLFKPPPPEQDGTRHNPSNERSLNSFQDNKGTDIKNKLPSGREDEVTEICSSISSDQESSPTSSSSVGSAAEDDDKRGLSPTLAEDEEEKTMDGPLMDYSDKELPYEPSNSWKANSKTPEKQIADDTKDATRIRNTKSDNFGSGPTRAASLPIQSTATDVTRNGHPQAEPDMLRSHVHPKLPDYDDVVAQLAAFRDGKRTVLDA